MSVLNCEGRTIWIVDAHRDDGKRFVVRADEILTAFMELESAIRGFSQFHAPCALLAGTAGVETPPPKSNGLVQPTPARYGSKIIVSKILSISQFCS